MRTETTTNFNLFTDELLKKYNNNIKIDFNKAYQQFKNNCKETEEHAGFGGWDSEYDYSDFIYAGLVWRFHWCNSGRKFVSVNSF